MDGEEYFLFMRYERGVVPRISLRNNNRSFRFETEYLSQGTKQEQSGKNTSFLQDNKDLMGLIIFEGSQQIAAVSFTNTPSIWYSNSLAKEQQGLALAVAYSFLMHKRLNRDWESLNNHHRVRK